jgi:hypothetical protein
VLADGPPPLQYQWKIDGAKIAGATNSAFVLTNPIPKQSGTYSVIVGTTPHTVISSNALLVVQIPPSITIQPQSQTDHAGTHAIFSVTATGTALRYQWLRNNSPLVGATNSTLILADIGTNNSGLYGVVVSNAVGVATGAAFLNVLASPPSIIVQPQSQSVWGGTPAALSVTIAGDAAALILPKTDTGALQLWLAADSGVVASIDGHVSQWDDLSGNGNDAVQTNVDQQPLLVRPAAIGEVPAIRFSGLQNSYQSQYLFASGAVEVPNAMTAFMVYEANSTTNSDESAFFIGAPGRYGGGRGDYLSSGKMAFTTWAYDYDTGYTVPTNSYRIWTDRLDTNGDLLEFFDDTLLVATNFIEVTSGLSPPDAGYYIGGFNPTVTAGRNFGGDIAELLIYSGVLADSDREAVVNYLKEKYYQTNSPANSFRWQFNGTNIPGATNETLTFPAIQAAQAGVYRVVVSNYYGAVTSSNAVLEVNLTPVIITQPSNQTVFASHPVTFTVKADGPVPLQYQWTFDGQLIPDATTSALIFNNTSLSQAGTYAVILGTSPNVAISSNAVLTVDPNSLIVSNLDENDLSMALLPGGTVTFATDGTIAVTNTITITYDVILDGAGHSITISGGGSVQLFNVPAGLSLTLRNLNLVNAYFEGPSAQYYALQYFGPACGGAIFSQGSLDIEDCVFSNNVAQGAAGSPAEDMQQEQPGAGGAIFNEGQMSIANTTFVSNSAIGGAGATLHGDMASGGESASGGAICNAGGLVVLSNVVFSGNRVIGGAPGVSDSPAYDSATGGPACGGAISSTGGTVVANVLRVVGNNAEGQGGEGVNLFNGIGGPAYAGGLYVSAGSVIVSNSLFSSNVAVGGTPAFYGSEGGQAQGGAIFNQGNLVLSQCVAYGNSAVAGGMSFEALGADAAGGAVYNAGVVTIQNSMVSSNTARGGAPTGNALGGGIANFGAVDVSATDLAANKVSGATNFGYSIYNAGVFMADTNSDATVNYSGSLPVYYDWQFNGTNIPGATSSTLNLTNVQFNVTSGYSLLISNSSGLITNFDEIFNQPLTNAPTFVLQPQGEMTNLGAIVEFDAAAIGFPSPDYQWWLNGAQIKGATDSSLILTNVLENQFGAYSVIAKNSLGSATSQPAVLTPSKTVLLTAVNLSSGRFSINGAGASGSNFVLQVSKNLIDWLPLQTNASPWTYTDTDAASGPSRFYRAILAPSQ